MYTTLYIPIDIVRNFLFPTAKTVSMNGSSPVGRCSYVTAGTGSSSSCNSPSTSVLFDGNIPKLSGLDRNIPLWASDLLTINASNPTPFSPYIIANFTTQFFVDRVELVMFNCLEWGQSIHIGMVNIPPLNFTPTIHSCESLVRVCRHVKQTLRSLFFVFHNDGQFNWLHLAEVTIYDNPFYCPPDTVVPTPPEIIPYRQLRIPPTKETGRQSTSTTQCHDLH